MKRVTVSLTLLAACLLALSAQAEFHGSWRGGAPSGWHGGGWHNNGWHGGWYGNWHGGYWWGPWVWWQPVVVAGVTYTVVDDIWYRDYGDGYVEVEPPAGYEGDVAPQVSATVPTPPTGDTFFAYPRSGQSEAQQAQDKYDCHKWARGQSGFDPTLVQGGLSNAGEVAAKRVEYRRAMTACLEGKGYTVR